MRRVFRSYGLPRTSAPQLRGIPDPDARRASIRTSTRSLTPAARTARIRRISVSGLCAAGAAAAALTLAPSPAQAAEPASHGVATSAAAVSATGISAQAHAMAENAHKASKVSKATDSDDLDRWIRKALKIMKTEGIPGTYEGLHRNIMRESGGDPHAANGWDVNAQNGTPSKGLLQVIQPTFEAYHVDGTAKSLTDPVANITAAANYAADRYGSIDNVDSAY
ncbi:transglycosylase SLT domain-containing protein [Streptomyces sp. JH34]|uniref:transglycosylase SLT domain-containing protein n=1 Tax=Streptomyces sp. JH34 TaxID=2793633 RepID=UPI0023FA11CF|nr:transglycosylase SLT domain-containing protein [Streptomyces sp. JH34]MDF6022573.1 transglycosylase SLT domain-containing protein [Streptomyces sp. JH34]